METTLFLAQFWGLVFVIVGAVLLVRRDDRKIILGMLTDDAAIFFTGFFALLIGIAHILLINTWSTDWTVILTLIGWLTFVKGFLRLAFPSTVKSLVKKFSTPSAMNFWLVVFIVVGIYLLTKGF